MKKAMIMFFCAGLLLASCGYHKAMKNPEDYLEKDAFPPDIKKDSYILLNEKEELSKITSPHQNRLVEGLMKKYYDKPYEMVSYKEIRNNSKYADKNVYRYVLAEMDVNAIHTINQGVSHTTFAYRDMQFTDRLTGKVFSPIGHAGATFYDDMKVIAPYLAKMK